MPETRYFTVRQVREVKVWANSPVGAAQVASAEFNGNDEPNIFEGAPTGEIREIDLLVREDRPGTAYERVSGGW